MAGDRYLIGTGARDWADPNIWSLTSGGAPYQPASGTEKITNTADREFSSDTGWWGKDVGWSITGGVAKAINAGSLYKGGLLIVNKSYKITFTILNRTSGGVRVNSFSIPNIYSTNGTYTIYAIATGIAFGFVGSGTFNGEIDNVSVQEVDTISPDETTPCIFDQNSGVGDVTLNANAVCASFNSVGLTSIVRVVSSVYTFSNYGDLTLNGTLSKFAFTGTAYYYQKGTGGITTNGNLFLALNRLYIDGVGITVTNGDDANMGTSSIYLSNGTWTTNNYNITFRNFSCTATSLVYLNLGSSAINVNEWYVFTSKLVVDSGTSTITTATNFYAYNYIWYNVVMNLAATMLQLSCVTKAFFTSLTLNGASGLSTGVTIADFETTNLTIIGVNASNYRLLIASNTIGTPRTITCNGTVTASNVDFRDITLAGTCNKDLSAITGGSGDCGGNSGITFTTAQPQYFKKYASTANVGDAANWFSDLALTVVGRVPLPQDLGSKFLATSFDRACTVTCNVPRIPCLDMSEVVNTVTWSLANDIEVYGSYVLGNNITPIGNFKHGLYGRGNLILKTYNKSITALSVTNPLGVYTLMSDLTISGLHLTIDYGTFDANDYNVTSFSFERINNLGNSTIYMGNGIWTASRSATNTIWAIYGATVYPENSTLIFNIASGTSNITFVGGGKTYNKIQFSGSHTGNFDISGSNNIAELIIDSGRKVRFAAGTTQTIAKATIAANVTMDCITASTYTLALADITTAENANIKGCIAPVSKFFAEANSVDSGSNTNVVFGDYFTPQDIMIENRIN